MSAYLNFVHGNKYENLMLSKYLTVTISDRKLQTQSKILQ